MKKVYIFILLVFSLSFSACENYKIERREIDDTLLVSVVGVDVSPEGKVLVTICPKIADASGNGSDVQSESYIINSEGDTLFDAIRSISTVSNGRPFLGNVDHIIIGENASKENILKYLDYFSRDHEFRLNVNVFVTKDCNAKDILEQASNSNIVLSDYLKSLLSNVDNNSMSSKIELSNLINKFDNRFLSPYIPCISLEKRNNPTISQFSIKLNGYGIFKNSKLIGYLMDKDARGLNWAIGKVKSGVIVVKDLNGDNIALEITETNSKIIPQFSNEKLSVLIKVRTSSNIAEIHGKEDVFTKDYFSYLGRQQNNIIKSEIKNAITFSSKNNSDIFDINGAIFHKYPAEWKRLQKQWNEFFPEIDITLDINSKINRSYEIKRPADSKDKEVDLE